MYNNHDEQPQINPSTLHNPLPTQQIPSNSLQISETTALTSFKPSKESKNIIHKDIKQITLNNKLS